MLPIQAFFIAANIVGALVSSSLTWLFADALFLRIEIKTTLKFLGFLLLTVAFAIQLVGLFSDINLPQLIIWIHSIALLLLFAAFNIDSHSRLQFLTILIIFILIFLDNHAMLSAQSFLIALVVLEIAKNTKHNDLIPFGIGFVLFAAAELFYSVEIRAGFQNISLGGHFLYIFGAIALFLWLWQYLVIRFNLAHKLPKVGI